MSEPANVPSYQVSDDAVAYLRAAGGWTRIVSILLILAIILIVLSAIASFVLAALIHQHRSDPPIWLIGVGLLPSVIFYIPPVIFLSNFSSRAKAYAATRNPEDLTIAMKSNKSFWKYIGILIVIGMFFNFVIAPLAMLIIMIINK